MFIKDQRQFRRRSGYSSGLSGSCPPVGIRGAANDLVQFIHYACLFIVRRVEYPDDVEKGRARFPCASLFSSSGIRPWDLGLRFTGRSNHSAPRSCDLWVCAENQRATLLKLVRCRAYSLLPRGFNSCRSIPFAPSFVDDESSNFGRSVTQGNYCRSSLLVTAPQ